MFTTPILDIAISLIFVYFIFAVIASSLNEIITGVLSTRADMLQTALKELIPKDADWEGLFEKIEKSPFIKSIQAKQGKFPSYIPSPVFAKAVVSAIQGNVTLKTEDKGLKTLIEKTFKNPETRDLMNSMVGDATDSIQTLQLNIEKLFNYSMDRLNGLYKRKIQKFILLISLLIAAGFNIDSIHIAKRLWNEPVLAKAAADQIQLYTANSEVLKNIKEQGTVNPTDTNAAIKPIKENINLIKEARAVIDQMPFPIGWVEGNYPVSFNFWSYATKLFGILLTAAAISLGAPFWFDLLNKTINMRNAGKKPEPAS